MRKVLTTLAAAAVFGSLSVSKSLADTVYLNEGDQINGTVTRIADGKMTLHSDTMGDVTIPMSHVRTFSTTNPIELHLTDGTVVNRPVTTSDAGQVLIAGDGLGAGQKVLVANIEDVNPKIFTGSFQIGGSLARGNSDTDTFSASVALEYKVKAEDVTFAAEYNFGKQKDRQTNVTSTTTDRWDLDAKYAHSFTPKFYGYVEGEVTKDRIAYLDLRFTPSGGVGYKWFDKEPFFFKTEAGAAWLYEEYTDGTPRKEEAALKFAYHLVYNFNPTVSAFNDVTYYPSLEYGNHYILNTDIGLHAKLTKNLFVEVKVEWDYDASPAQGNAANHIPPALKNDERYMATLGYSL